MENVEIQKPGLKSRFDNAVVFNAEEVKMLRKKLGVFRRLKTHTSVLPILECVLITVFSGKVTFEYTDLEAVMVFTIKIEQKKPERQFMFCVDFNDLWKVIYNTTESLQLTYNEAINSLSLATGPFTLKLATEKWENFPKKVVIGSSDILAEYTFGSKDLFPVIKQAIPWTSNDDLRPAMTGVCLQVYQDELHVVATDAHCLYKKAVKITEDVKRFQTLIIQKTSCRILTDIFTDGEVRYTQTANHLVIQNEEYFIISRILDCRFPDWPVVLTTCDYVFYVKRAQLKAFIYLAENFTNKSTGQVELITNGIDLQCVGGDLDFSKEFEYKIPVYQATSIDHRFAMNIYYLKKAINLSTDDLVKFSHTGSSMKGFFFDNIMMMPLMLNQ